MTKRLFFGLLLIGLFSYVPYAVIFYTDFETDQWSLSGSGANTWEYEADRGEPRTTDHPNSAIPNGRRGFDRGVWLGDYNNNSTRNEISKDDVANTMNETWVGFSMYIEEALPGSRVYAQFRNRVAPDDPLKGTGIAVKNPITLRQHPNVSDRMYFAMLTDPAFAEVCNNDTGGASADAEAWPKNHPEGGYGFTYNLDEWIDVVIYWTQLSADGGTIKIWINGELLVDHTGVTNYRLHPVSCVDYSGLLKHTIGVYWSSTNPPQGSAYFDEYIMKEAPAEYQDVSYHCQDGIQNNQETGVDCGGPCAPCGPVQQPKFVNTLKKGSRNLKMNGKTVKIIPGG